MHPFSLNLHQTKKIVTKQKKKKIMKKNKMYDKAKYYEIL